MTKILLVEDDQNLATELCEFLRFQKYDVTHLADGSEASSHVRVYDYDLIVLDWNLPGKSGIEILKEMQERGAGPPVLMLTANTSVDSRISGLDSGADDYLTKPFNVMELGARLKALLRRPSTRKTDSVDAGPLRLNETSRKCFFNDQEVNLTKREFELLIFLARHKNEVFALEALLNRVWPTDSEATAEVVRSTIKRLRKKIDPEGSLLTNIYGAGYSLSIGDN